MSPSLFNNEYSRGPLYQYWKERGQEEKVLRDQRIKEAGLRSKGHQPLSPTYGPSSNDQYAHRATSGPPAYRNDEGESGDPDRSSQPSELPSYGQVAGRETEASAADQEPVLLSAEEEKARLRQLEEQRRQIADDAAIAQTLSHESAEEGQGEGEVQGNGKQPARRKSTAAKVGGWLADAASGYTKNQGRW